MDGVDRVLAVIFTLMAIILIIGIVAALVASFIAHPIGTIVVITATIWLFRRIYPHIVRFMEKEEF